MKVLNLIKNVIKHEINKAGLYVDRIILFGSRARGDHTENSDWDILVITDKALSPVEKRRIRANLSGKLLRMGIDCEIILKSKRSYNVDKDIANTISYSAFLEGVEI